MQKIKKILFKQPLLSLAALCFAIAIMSPFVFVENASQAKQEVTKDATPTATVTPSPEVDEQSVQGQTSYNYVVTPSVSQQAPTSSAQQATQPAATNTPQPTHSASSGQAAPAKHTFQVSLKINGSSLGNVDMEEGNNQCDVLSRAKDQGKISQLMMKYDNSLGTNGVYQINGIGKENAVWWVYKVNGASPSQGCSYIKANSGDAVEWEYKG